MRYTANRSATTTYSFSRGRRVGVRASLGTYPFRGGRRFWSGYGGDTPCPAVKAAAPVLPCPFLRERESGGCTYKQVRKQIATTLKYRLLLNLSKSSLHFNYFFIFIDLDNLHGTTATRRSTLLPLPLRRTGGRRDSLICGQGAVRRNRRDLSIIAAMTTGSSSV